MITEAQRKSLGDFVRAHRERAVPNAIASRRRTPGLRREELAARAGISPTWCAWIEQGREVHASPEALGRLAMALDLSRAERAYLFELAGRRDPEAPASIMLVEAPASLLAAIGSIMVPSYGLDRCWNACCWNEAAQTLFTGWLDEGTQKNLLRFVFLDPRAKSLIPDWEIRAFRILAEFRTDFSRGFADPRTRAVVEDLRRESAVFSKAWDTQDVLEREGGLRSFNGPTDVHHFEQHTFSPADRPDLKLVILTPLS